MKMVFWHFFINKRIAIFEFNSIRSNSKIATKLQENEQIIDIKYTDWNGLANMSSCFWRKLC